MDLIFPILERKAIESLKAGDEVTISGVIYTARDQAHKILVEWVSKKDRRSEFLKGSCIFYAGPAFYPDERLSAIGPTTASRMDAFAPLLYREGVVATLGKGPRSGEVAEACRETKSLYLVTYGGAAAYLTGFIKSIEAYELIELGPEAIYRLEVARLPAVVGIDSNGNIIEGLLL